MAFVKLRDKGTIFHDTATSTTITGTLPKEVKLTPKVKQAITKGILILVDDAEAKKAITTATASADKAKDDTQASTDEAIVVIQGKLSTALDAKSKSDEALKEANAKIAKLEAGASNLENYALKSESVPKSTHDEVVKKLASTDVALTKTKEALAKALKK